MDSRKFLWGVATSAFQLEGSPYADWTSWDDILCDIPDITNHYRCYKEDLRLLNDLGVNAYRFSVEWSRIQPRENHWELSALERYQEIVSILLDRGITPFVTLHHFTHPLWFIKKYPWHKPESSKAFITYVERVVSFLKGVRYWITFNEPYVLILGGYLEGCMPPGIRDTRAAVKALENILICHGIAYDLIHTKRQDAMVSIAHNMAALTPWCRWNPLDRMLSNIARRFYNGSLIELLKTGRLIIELPLQKPISIEIPIAGKVDFMGINYYTRIHLRFNPLKNMAVELRHRDLDGKGLTDMGWEIHPKGLAKVIKLASGLKVPIFITENGIATRNAQRKIAYMRQHIDVIERCLKEGYDIRGYFYWSLIDNYEWLEGLDARFGLYQVDFQTLQRKPTSAAKYYSYLIKSRIF